MVEIALLINPYKEGTAEYKCQVSGGWSVVFSSVHLFCRLSTRGRFGGTGSRSGNWRPAGVFTCTCNLLGMQKDKRSWQSVIPRLSVKLPGKPMPSELLDGLF